MEDNLEIMYQYIMPFDFCASKGTITEKWKRLKWRKPTLMQIDPVRVGGSCVKIYEETNGVLKDQLTSILKKEIK